MRDKIPLDYALNNHEGADRVIHRWISVLKSIGGATQPVLPLSIYSRRPLPEQVLAHQSGTCRFGIDPKTSVLDLNCPPQDVENLYVVDGSFFSSN